LVDEIHLTADRLQIGLAFRRKTIICSAAVDDRGRRRKLPALLTT